VDKDHIIAEIRRTAADNAAVPLGQRTFERETGISISAWRGKYWRNWGEAVKEAGFVTNRLHEAHDRLFLILSLTQLTRKNRCFPTYVDIRLERAINKPLVRQYAKEHPEYEDVLDILPSTQISSDGSSPDASAATTKEGYVYMISIKVGREKRYKIGKAVLVERRRDQIAPHLPEKEELAHVINTDDAYGIEGYWHRRFAEKRTNGEWFALSREDIQAFKKRKFM
jgi:Meiotically Up-regulated Gene 113 (MUG113) protein